MKELTLCVCVVFAMSGCGKPGYQLDVARACTDLHRVTNTNEIRAWLKTEIEAGSRDAPKLPAEIQLPELPPWVNSVYGSSPPGAILYLSLDATNSYIKLLWVHGRGMLGIMIGNESFKPTLNPDDYYVLKCDPGIFPETLLNTPSTTSAIAPQPNRAATKTAGICALPTTPPTTSTNTRTAACPVTWTSRESALRPTASR
jgi:hypothetical protein